jgi:hypothetical protein
MSAQRRTTHKRVGVYTVTRRPNAEGTNLADKTQPVIIVSGPGVYQMMTRASLLCGVPDGRGGTVSIDAVSATPEQVVWALTHDESVFA